MKAGYIAISVRDTTKMAVDVVPLM